MCGVLRKDNSLSTALRRGPGARPAHEPVHEPVHEPGLGTFGGLGVPGGALE
eukprot:COSAG03_NODE_19253_length_340_cov_0.854772_1_plen_51_part_01